MSKTNLRRNLALVLFCLGVVGGLLYFFVLRNQGPEVTGQQAVLRWNEGLEDVHVELDPSELAEVKQLTRQASPVENDRKLGFYYSLEFQDGGAWMGTIYMDAHTGSSTGRFTFGGNYFESRDLLEWILAKAASSKGRRQPDPRTEP